MTAPSRLRLLLVCSLLGAPGLFAQAAPPAVRTVAPAPAPAADAYAVPGHTEPFESARIFTRATGIVKERRFDIGDAVKAGDILAVIDVPDLDRAVDSAQANVEQAAARAANARTLAEHSTSLRSSDAISREDADQRAANAAISDAALRVARADLDRLEEQRNFALVRAPFDGVVAARNFDRGDRVRGDAATAEGWLYYLVRLDTMRFVLSGTPDLAMRLKPDTVAKVSFAEFPGRPFAAKVSRASRVFDPAAGTMRLELLLENPGLTLPAGLTGTATFNLAPTAGTFLVPTNTLITRAGQNLLATVQAGKVAFVEVQAGRNFGANVEVTSAALSSTSAVIINPNALLRPGDAVSVTPPSAPK